LNHRDTEYTEKGRRREKERGVCITRVRGMERETFSPNNVPVPIFSPLFPSSVYSVSLWFNSNMAKVIVGTVDEIGPGQRKIVEVNGVSIGVFNIHGQFYALRNSCPHQGAPLCLGSLKGTTLPSAPGEYKWGREGEIIRCPWHGWEFDALTGRSIFNPHRLRVKSYEVSIEPADAVEEDPSVETYPVTVEASPGEGADRVVLHV
jgi:nitrite reductase (NADH) small subunit